MSTTSRDRLRRLLREHRERQLARGLARPTDFVFASEAGTPLSARNVAWRGLEAAAVKARLMPSREQRKLAQVAGVDVGLPVTMHTLRRTFASHLILDLKLDAVQVSKQMGHARPSITQDAYADLFDNARHADEIREAMAASAFGKVLESAGGERRRTGTDAAGGEVVELQRFRD
jgi:integrase